MNHNRFVAFLKRAKVILTAAPTYLVALAAVVSVVADEAAKTLPVGWQDNAAQIAGAVLGVIAAAVAIVRRVTPVIDAAARGILPNTPRS
jgi:type IV secretory pathway VirB2 component (pilin)